MIRIASEADAAEILRIYAPAVRDEVISFETVIPSLEEMQCRIRTTLPLFPWLVYQDQRQLHGFAYASAYRSRESYRWSVEVSIYVDSVARRRGLGRLLYARLFEILKQQGYCVAVAGIAIPNDASQRMHESLGFESAGVIVNVGYKMGAWRDVGWWILRLAPVSPNQPSNPIPFSQWRMRYGDE